MNVLGGERILPIDEIDSDADFILVDEGSGLLSEHCTMGEARMAFYEQAGRHGLGEHLPLIYRREDSHWVPLS